MQSADANDRTPISWSWNVTGLAAGSRIFKIQAQQNTASIWTLPANQMTLSVRRVA